MKVLLISNYRPDKQQSMLRYAEMLRRELQDRGHEVSVVYPPTVLGGLTFWPGPLKKLIGYIDKYLFAPAYLRKQARKTDIVHICDHSNAMYLPCAGSRPSLITCHDLLAIFAARGLYPQVRIGFTGRLQQRWIARHLSRASHIICASAKTQDDLELLAPGIRPRTQVIHHTLNWPYTPASPDAIAGVKKSMGLEPEAQYLLHVGGNQWYKNRLGVLRIFAELRKYPRFQNVKLVMAGKPWTAEMRRYYKSSGLGNAAIERVEVSNEDLQALYSGALALLFPSFEEGFGWPVLEAQACGCPVITSNRAPMTEIAEEGALFIDPNDPESAARSIVKQTSNLPSLRTAGFRNLGRFDREKMIDCYLKFYELVIGKTERVVTTNTFA
jgi:glycosyltransferase involved in cell wall biosynthesis